MQQTHGFSVPFRFPVHFTRDAWSPANTVFADVIRREESDRRHRVLAIVDAQVASAHPALSQDIAAYFSAFPDGLDLVAAPVIVPGGEAVKNDFSHPLEILKRINEVGLDRQSFVVVIGGGAVLDMVSFAAAIAHRGVRVVRFPTTVLSQADSGIAVKNGINLFGKKNFVGTFVPPFAVINDSASSSRSARAIASAAWSKRSRSRCCATPVSTPISKRTSAGSPTARSRC